MLLLHLPIGALLSLCLGPKLKENQYKCDPPEGPNGRCMFSSKWTPTDAGASNCAEGCDWSVADCLFGGWVAIRLVVWTSCQLARVKCCHAGCQRPWNVDCHAMLLAAGTYVNIPGLPAGGAGSDLSHCTLYGRAWCLRPRDELALSCEGASVRHVCHPQA